MLLPQHISYECRSRGSNGGFPTPREPTLRASAATWGPALCGGRLRAPRSTGTAHTSGLSKIRLPTGVTRGEYRAT
jgi:hypothetical protein